MISNLGDRIFLGVSLLAWISVSLIVYPRLHLGVDFTDEAYYSAQSFVFWRGIRPFHEEILSTQSAFVLLQPIPWLLYKVQGSLDGIVLLFRYLYVILALASGVVFVKFLKGFLPLPEAAMGALPLVMFWPFGIPSLSYNTISMLFFSVGCIFVFEASWKTRMHINLCGILLILLASYCYPPLILGSCVVLFHLRSRKHLAATLAVLMGFLIALCVVYIGPHRILDILRYSRSDGEHFYLLRKLFLFGDQLWRSKDLVGAGILMLALIAILSRKRRFYSASAFLALGGLVLSNVISLKQNVLPPNHLMILILMFVGVGASFLTVARDGKDPLFLLSIISGLGAIVTAFASANGLMNAPIGGILAALVGIVYLHRLGGAHSPWRRTIFFLICLSILTIQIRDLLHHPFGDGPSRDLTEFIGFGPFRGLKTGKQKAVFLSQISQDMMTFRDPSKTIAIFDSFPAGYLIADMPMLAPTVFPVSPNLFPVDRAFLARSFLRFKEMPDYFIWMNRVPVTSKHSYELEPKTADPVQELLALRYKPIIVRSDYTVLQRK
jgi:hypothetical protein